MRYLLFTTGLFFILPAVVQGQADSAIIRHHLVRIIDTPEPRNFSNPGSLNLVASYIFEAFDQYGDSTVYQEYQVGKETYKNVITSFGIHNSRRIIIGAHYDVCGKQDGADDNASGVVGLLELARLLHETELAYRIDLVAYTLEEPPFFRTTNMGSYVHAKYLYDQEIDVYGMICLEMIGYFSDEKNSQRYPLGLLRLFYGSRGDFITVVRKFGGGRFSRIARRKIKRSGCIKTRSIVAPERLRGIDFSDHLNYWGFGYSAVMITNTGFYRNSNYHQSTDVLRTLDIGRMARVIDAVYEGLEQIQ